MWDRSDPHSTPHGVLFPLGQIWKLFNNGYKLPFCAALGLKARMTQIQRGALRERNLQGIINIERSNYLGDTKVSDWEMGNY